MGNFENMRSQQGFYVYRNNRLIIWGTWLHMMGVNELYKNARIEVNIPNTLDDIWKVDIKKASATIPGIIRQPLFSHVKKAIASSSNVYKKRGENTSSQVGHQVVWNISEERDSYEITANPMPPRPSSPDWQATTPRSMSSILRMNTEPLRTAYTAYPSTCHPRD